MQENKFVMFFLFMNHIYFLFMVLRKSLGS